MPLTNWKTTRKHVCGWLLQDCRWLFTGWQDDIYRSISVLVWCY